MNNISDAVGMKNEGCLLRVCFTGEPKNTSIDIGDICDTFKAFENIIIDIMVATSNKNVENVTRCADRITRINHNADYSKVSSAISGGYDALLLCYIFNSMASELGFDAGASWVRVNNISMTIEDVAVHNVYGYSLEKVQLVVYIRLTNASNVYEIEKIFNTIVKHYKDFKLDLTACEIESTNKYNIHSISFDNNPNTQPQSEPTLQESNAQSQIQYVPDPQQDLQNTMNLIHIESLTNKIQDSLYELSDTLKQTKYIETLKDVDTNQSVRDLLSALKTRCDDILNEICCRCYGK